MKSLLNTVWEIKELKIQGAEAVAVQALRALGEVMHRERSDSPKKIISQLSSARKKLEAARPTEPALQNSMKFVFDSLRQDNTKTNLRTLREFVLEAVQKALNHFENSKNAISEIGSSKIKNGAVVYTHCHSSTVENILLKAKENGIKFEVHNTETRPMFQGRTTAKHLAKHNISVTHYVDSAARLALKKADIMLIGCDAITAERVINKIGSELIAEAAQQQEVPVYVCTDSWKFDACSIRGKEVQIENRAPEEVWEKPPKGVKITNPAFERIAPHLISGIISEIGVYPHNIFVEELKRDSPWLFDS